MHIELKSASKRYRRAHTHYKIFFQNDVEDIVAKTFQTSDRVYFVTYLIFYTRENGINSVQPISITIRLNQFMKARCRTVWMDLIGQF